MELKGSKTINPSIKTNILVEKCKRIIISWEKNQRCGIWWPFRLPTSNDGSPTSNDGSWKLMLSKKKSNCQLHKNILKTHFFYVELLLLRYSSLFLHICAHFSPQASLNQLLKYLLPVLPLKLMVMFRFLTPCFENATILQHKVLIHSNSFQFEEDKDQCAYLGPIISKLLEGTYVFFRQQKLLLLFSKLIRTNPWAFTIFPLFFILSLLAWLCTGWERQISESNRNF